MRMLSILFLLGIALVANSETCPSEAEMTPCRCKSVSHTDNIKVECQNVDDELRGSEDLANPMRYLAGKKNIVMEIDHFDLRKMPFDFFQGIGIVQLYISRCALPSINEENQKVLIGLENSIEGLRIKASITADNDLSKLSFAHLRKLREVQFYRNNISDVHAAWFEDSTVEVVGIAHNDVVNVEEGAFAGLKNLKLLRLRAENQHGAFRRSLLPDPADHLTLLDLDFNNYAGLDKDMFSDMPKLNQVHLNGNRIRTLDKDTWESVWEQLDFLNLHGNPIECDSDLEWTFAMRRPRRLSGMCEGPKDMEGRSIQDFIDKGRAN